MVVELASGLHKTVILNSGLAIDSPPDEAICDWIIRTPNESESST